MVAIIDYGIGNLGSVANMLKKIGINPIVTSEPEEILKAEKLILCGVGAFDDGIINIKTKGLFETINEKVIVQKSPILGICLGMQLFTEKSEEGKEKGFGWINAETVKFNFSEQDLKLKIPHIGWNEVKSPNNSRLFQDILPVPRFYFVHSFHVKMENEKEVSGITEYGYNFTSAFEKDNILGVQFHPEKSHKYGMKLLKNFIDFY